MKFLMLVCGDSQTPGTVSPTIGAETDEWVSTMDARGVRVTGDMLGPEAAAAVVRVRDGRRLVTDGPYLETKEALGGFDLLECRDLDEAIEVAAAHPVAKHGLLEIRPIVEF